MIDSESRPHGNELSKNVLLSLVESCGIVGPRAADISRHFAATGRQSSTAESADLLLDLVGRCADERHPVAYLSVPLTTGHAYIECNARRDDTKADNKRRAHEAAQRLRAFLSDMVIDPSRLADVPGWEQADYHAFWTKVIDQHADKVIFLDGWQYSDGCTIEFAKAVQLGLPRLTEYLMPLNVAAGSQ
jgi:hypothetical protein